jgi:hypothetical protein
VGPGLIVIGVIQLLLALFVPKALIAYPGTPERRRIFGLLGGSGLVAVGTLVAIL